MTRACMSLRKRKPQCPAGGNLPLQVLPQPEGGKPGPLTSVWGDQTRCEHNPACFLGRMPKARLSRSCCALRSRSVEISRRTSSLDISGPRLSREEDNQTERAPVFHALVGQCTIRQESESGDAITRTCSARNKDREEVVILKQRGRQQPIHGWTLQRTRSEKWEPEYTMSFW